MLRLVKGAYWDAEIKRAEVDGLPGYPVFTRKVHTDVAYLACAKAMLGGARRDLSAVREPQRVHHRRGPRARRRRAVRVPVPARHGREHLRRGRREGKARPRLPHLRAGRLARDAARLPGAAAARERRQQLVRQPDRRPDGRHRVAGRRPGRRRRGDAAAGRMPASRCPSRCCRAAAIRRVSTFPTTGSSRRWKRRSRNGSGSSAARPSRRSAGRRSAAPAVDRQP